MRKAMGALFVLSGIVLVVLGLDESGTVRSEISRLAEGVPTHRTLWLIVGGVATGILGLALLASPRRGR